MCHYELLCNIAFCQTATGSTNILKALSALLFYFAVSVNFIAVFLVSTVAHRLGSAMHPD